MNDQTFEKFAHFSADHALPKVAFDGEVFDLHGAIAARYSDFFLVRYSDKSGKHVRVSRRSFPTLEEAAKAAVKVDRKNPKWFTFVEGTVRTEASHATGA